MRRPTPARSKRKRKSVSTATLDSVVALVNTATGTEAVKGEDLINDPKLKAQFVALKKQGK